MKIGGKKVSYAPNSEIIVFSRGEEPEIAFRATAMLDRTQFDKLCPPPKVPKMRGRGNTFQENPDDPKYIQAMQRFNKMFMDYMFITSLSVLPEKKEDPDLPIEWEKVNVLQKETWYLWETELQDIGLGDMERKRLFNVVMSVNSLNDAKMEEARKSFLLRQQEGLQTSSSSMDEQNDTQSGELANDSESDLQESQLVGTNSTNQ